MCALINCFLQCASKIHVTVYERDRVSEFVHKLIELKPLEFSTMDLQEQKLRSSLLGTPSWHRSSVVGQNMALRASRAAKNQIF